MFVPEQRYKKCPWWHRIFRRFKWFRCWCKYGAAIEFKGIRLPLLPLMPSLNLSEIAAVQKMDSRTATIFYLDTKDKDV